MKKLFLILLMLCASFAPVHADDTQVTLTYTVPESYTVSIPASVTVNDTASFNISLSNAVLEPGKTLSVSTNSSNYSSGWRMKNGTSYQSYTLKNGSTNIVPDDAIISLPAGDPSASASATLTAAMQGTPSASGTYTDSLIFTFISEKKPNAKYAVAIYGIGQDVDQNGNAMGLTFGPATGADYVNSYKSHTPSGNTTSGNAHRCVHNDDWETIIHWNSVDPNVYEQCISEGCTHSIELYLNETLFNSSLTVYNSGDGPSILYKELLTNDTNYQHLEWNPLQATGSTSYGNNVGGWGTSRIRAMMNGADSLTQTGTTYGTSVTGNYLPTMAATDYNSSNSLLSCFPTTLQNAIGSRKTIYHGKYNSNTQSVCYDKLFLLSQQEVSTSTVSQRANEGTTYQKFASGSHTHNSTDASRIGYRLSSYTATSGESYSRWFRSPHYSNAYGAYGVSSSGEANLFGFVMDCHGVSPCFALSR